MAPSVNKPQRIALVRWTRAILVLIGIGLLISIAVSWAAALWSPLGYLHADFVDRGSGDICIYWETGPGVAVIGWHPLSGGFSWQGEWNTREPLPSWLPDWSGIGLLDRDYANQRLEVMGCGWPFMAMKCIWHIDQYTMTESDFRAGRAWQTAPDLPRAYGGFQIRTPSGPDIPSGQDAGLLPYYPVWRGLAANSLLYAAAVWIVLKMPCLLWRAARRRRGRCTACGYDLRRDYTAGCPECGWGRTPAASNG